MKKKDVVKRTSTLILSLAVMTSSAAFGHSGRTDSSGGHKDNKNASGLGSYHYHHGMGAHLHPNGVCPYGNSSARTTTPTSTSSSTQKTTYSAPKAIYARVPNFPVKISGTDINTANAQYPPLLFSDVTYIPLTSDILEHLSLDYKWDDPSNLYFSRKSDSNKNGFSMRFTGGSSWYGNTVEITKVNKGISVNNLWVSNQYPVINYKGINYLPLTSDVITNLGLSGGWTQVDGFDLNLK